VEWEIKGRRSAVEDAKEGSLGQVCGLACLRVKSGEYEDLAVEHDSSGGGKKIVQVLTESIHALSFKNGIHGDVFREWKGRILELVDNLDRL
jgi:hypothetical protein